MHYTFNDALSDFCRDIKLKDTSLASYVKELKNFRSYLDRIGVGEEVNHITRSHIMSYVNGKKTNTTKARTISILRTFFNYLYFNGKTVEALMYGVKRPRAENEMEEAEFLSRADQKRLLMIRTSLDPHLAARDRAIILLCLDAGLRLMEVHHLTWDDVDLDAKKLKLKDREVPFSGRLADALQELRIYSTSLYVAANQDTGKPLSPASITRIVKTVGELAGIADLNCNRLRQNYGIEQAKKGFTIEEIGKIMGISTRRAEWYYQEARRTGKKKERGKNSD